MRMDFEVRDYECDVQGIVNNAVYLNYLEHARHKYLLAKDINFIDLAKEDKNLVLREAHYTYHKSLFPDDKFQVETEAVLEGKVKLCFKQKIFRAEELILESTIIGACVDGKSGKVLKISDILSPNFLEN